MGEAGAEAQSDDQQQVDSCDVLGSNARFACGAGCNGFGWLSIDDLDLLARLRRVKLRSTMVGGRTTINTKAGLTTSYWINPHDIQF